MDIHLATDVFCDSIAFGRSFTHPCYAERIGGVRVVRDGPRTRGTERVRQVVVCSDSVEECVELYVQNCRGTDFGCLITTDLGPNRALINHAKSRGFRYGSFEPMFARGVVNVPECGSAAEVRRVVTFEDAERLAKVARSRQILDSHLGVSPTPIRSYIAEVEGEIVGWVRSIHVVDRCAYPSNLNVLAAYRRRGIGRTLMCEMLRDDARHGVEQSVLLASHTGAMLYDTIGYDRIGTLHLFNPKKG